MKKKLWGISFVALSFCGMGRADPEPGWPSFVISKDKNRNLVQYDVRKSNACTFDRKNPVEVYWRTYDPKAQGDYRPEDLNLIERGLYGLDYDRILPQEVEAQVKVLKAKGIDARLKLKLQKLNGKCELKTIVQGEAIPQAMELSGIQLKKFKGESPQVLTVSGRDVRSKKTRVIEIKP